MKPGQGSTLPHTQLPSRDATMLGAPPMTYLFLVASWGPGLTGEGSDLAAAAPQQRAQGIHSHWDLAGGDS